MRTVLAICLTIVQFASWSVFAQTRPLDAPLIEQSEFPNQNSRINWHTGVNLGWGHQTLRAQGLQHSSQPMTIGLQIGGGFSEQLIFGGSLNYVQSKIKAGDSFELNGESAQENFDIKTSTLALSGYGQYFFEGSDAFLKLNLGLVSVNVRAKTDQDFDFEGRTRPGLITQFSPGYEFRTGPILAIAPQLDFSNLIIEGKASYAIGAKLTFRFYMGDML